jgi:hypothetical protein
VILDMMDDESWGWYVYACIGGFYDRIGGDQSYRWTANLVVR